MKQRVLRNPAAALVVAVAGLVVLAVLWLVVIVTAPRPDLPVGATGAADPTATSAPSTTGSHVSTGVLAPDETTPIPAPTTPAAPTSSDMKRGTATCRQAAAGVAALLGDSRLSNGQWSTRLAPYVSTGLAATLPTVDRTGIPAGAATVAHVYEQAGACDVMIRWATNPPAQWLLTVEDRGAGWVVTGWARS